VLPATMQGLVLRKAHQPASVGATWSFWFHIYVTNTAASAATGVIITDILPTGIVPYSVQASPGGTFDGAHTVTWTLASLGPGFGQQLWIKARSYSWAAGSCLTNVVHADSLQAAPPLSATDKICFAAGPAGTATPTPTPTATPTVTPTPLPGTWITIRKGLNGDCEDTFIYRYAPNTNYWLDPLLKVGYRQTHATLLRFDLSPIPPGAVVDEARLEVYAAGWSGPGANITVGAYAISATTCISETTWNASQGSSSWSAAGGNDTLLDRRALAEAVVQTNGARRWYGFDLTRLAQEWASGAIPNHGVLLRQEVYNSFTYLFASGEYSDPDKWPRLQVRYR